MTIQNQNIRKILIAPDKFKGSLTSAQAAAAIQKGIEEKYNEPLQFRIVEIADGGDGSLEVLQKKIQGAEIAGLKVHDPVGRIVDSQILVYGANESGNGAGGSGRCAFIEMAKVSGLEMLSKGERNPLYTSTYGMGEAIKYAIGMGVHQITLSIGGSATNDGGAGMLQALGYRFMDTSGREIASPICGGDLLNVAAVVAPGGEDARQLQQVQFRVICDVTNPLLGLQGATAVYGPQKGADAKGLQLLEEGLENYASVSEKSLGIAVQAKERPGAGAAGGVGYAGLAFLRAELIPGWKFFAQITSLEESVQWADLVITGEGSLDSQSMSGKVVSGVLNLASKYGKPVIIFCGVNKLSPAELGGIPCFPIASLGLPLETCMRDAAILLQQLARDNA